MKALEDYFTYILDEFKLYILFYTSGMFCRIIHMFRNDTEKAKVPHFLLLNS